MIKLNPKLQNSNISTANSLVFNSLKIVVNVLFPFMLIPYISRILSVEQIGVFNWDLTLVNYLTVLAGLSLPIIGIREIGLVKKDPLKVDSIINNIFIIKCYTILLSIVVIGIICYINVINNNTLILLILSLIIVVEILAHEWVYIAFGDQKFILFRNFISKLFLLVATFSLVKDKSDFYLFIVIYTLSSILPFIISYNYLFEKFRPNYIKFKDLKYLDSSTLKSFLVSLLMSFYGKIDVIILGLVLTSKELGIFTSAYKLIMLALVFITTWSMVLLPKSSLLHGEDEEKYINFISKSLDLVLVFGSFVTITLIMYSKNIVLLIFGENFYEAYSIINYLAPIIILLSVYNVLIFQVLYVKDKYIQIIKLFSLLYFIFISAVFFNLLSLNAILLCILFMNIIQLLYTWQQALKIYPITLFDKNKLKIYGISVTILVGNYLYNSFNLLGTTFFLEFLIMTSLMYFSLLYLLKENITSILVKKLIINRRL